MGVRLLQQPFFQGDYVHACHLAPTPVNFPVSHPKGVFRFPPRGPRPPPSDNGFDDK